MRRRKQGRTDILSWGIAFGLLIIFIATFKPGLFGAAVSNSTACVYHQCAECPKCVPDCTCPSTPWTEYSVPTIIVLLLIALIYLSYRLYKINQRKLEKKKTKR